MSNANFPQDHLSALASKEGISINLFHRREKQDTEKLGNLSEIHGATW